MAKDKGNRVPACGIATKEIRKRRLQLAIDLLLLWLVINGDYCISTCTKGLDHTKVCCVMNRTVLVLRAIERKHHTKESGSSSSVTLRLALGHAAYKVVRRAVGSRYFIIQV